VAVTLSAATEAAALKTHADVCTLLKIEFTKPITGTLRFSDRHLASCGGAEWLPYVVRWGRMTSRFDLQDASVSPETFSVTLDNSRAINGKARLSDYIWTPQNTRSTYEWSNAKVTVSQALSETAAAGDLVTLGVFYVDEPRAVGRTELEISMSDVTLALENKMELVKVTTDDFATAPAAILNRYIPVLFGDLTATGRKITALPVIAGKKTALTVELSATGATATVESTTGFSSSGYLLINGELIQYTGVTSTTFTGLTRGVSSSDGTLHESGTSVLKVRTGSQAFRLAVGMNIYGGTNAVSTVFARGVQVASPITTTTTLAATDLVTGYSFAVIDVDAGSSEADYYDFYCLGSGKTVATTTTMPASDTDTTSTNAVGTTFPAKSRLSVQPESVTVRVKMTWTDGAPVVSNARLRLDDFGSTQDYLDEMVNGQEYTVTVPVPSYDTSITWRFLWDGTAAAMNCQVLEAYYTWPDVGQSGAQSSADATIGEVTALVQGIKDDGSGTISGTPDLLLENPTDIGKAIVLGLYATTPGVLSADLGTTWAASRTKHATKGYEWALSLDYTSFSALRTEALREGRALLYAAGGKVEWKFLDDGPSVDHTVDYASDAEKSSPALLDRVDRTRLRNSLTVESQYDPADGEYDNTVTWEDLTQPGFEDAVPETLSLPWVHDTTMRDDLGRFWRDQWKRPRMESEFSTAYNLIALQVADVVEFTGHVILAEHGGTGVSFLAVGRSVDPARGTFSATLREACNLFWDRESFAQAFTDEPRAVPALVPIQYANSQRTLARRNPAENNNVYGGRNRLLSAMGG